MKWISFFTLTIFLTLQLRAREWSEFYTNSRSTAMGGVQIALSSDDTSLFRNPANLGSFRGMYATLLDPEFEVSQKFTDQFSNSLATFKKVTEVLNTNHDKYYHAKLQVTPSFSFRDFGIGLIYKNEISAIMNSAGTAMDTIYHDDIGILIGYNYSLWDGQIKLGGSIHAINRIEIDNPAVDPTGSLELKDVASEGTGIGADIALMLQPAVTYFPTFSVLVRDVGNTKYTTSPGLRLKTITQPNTVMQSIDAGFSVMPIHSKSFRSILAFEYRDLQNSHQDDFQNKRMHAGIEFNWSDIFYLRFGMNQNYISGGIEISSERMSWQLSTYSAEVGTQALPLEDRRYATKILVRF